MFGTPYRYNSLPKLSSSSAIFAGLCYGRTPKEKFDIGNACDPRVTFSDSKTYLIDGREETFHTSMPFAVAAARHGDLNLFLGVVASPHFFWTIPYSERNDRQEHVGKTLAEACACEAFARGHLEMFDGIVAAAKLASAKDLQHKHDRDRHSLSAATHFLEMNMTSVEYIFDWLSLGSERDTGKLAEAFERIATLVSSEFGQKGLPNLRQRLSQLWLDAGLAHGNEAAARSAISLGAAVGQRDVFLMAQNGLLDLAREFAPKAAPETKQSRERRRGSNEDTICEAISSSLGCSLPNVANGMESWRDPREGGREMTWAIFSDNHADIRKMAVLALAGSFDSPGQDAAKIAAAKKEIVSYCRALAVGMPNGHEFVAELATMDSQAPATPEELLFLARISPENLGPSFARAPQKTMDALLNGVMKLHANARKFAKSPPLAPKGSLERDLAHYEREHSRWASTKAVSDKIEESLFIIYNHQPLLSASGRDDLLDYVSRTPGMAEAYEARALSLSTPNSAARSGKGPLRV